MFANPDAENPAKFNWKNFKNYFSAQVRNLVYLPPWEKEQAMWRAEKAKPCTKKGSCLECGCDTPDLYLGTQGCKKTDNPCFPDMMGFEEWEIFKIENNIKL